MFCHNCGNKLGKDSPICLYCGEVVNNPSYKKKSNSFGIISIVLGIISLLLSIKLLMNSLLNINNMTILELINYLCSLLLPAVSLTIITFVLAVNKKSKNNDLNIIAILFSIFSLFFILTKIGIVIANI